MRRAVAVIAAIVVIAVVAVIALRPFGKAKTVETATVTRGSLESTVELAGTLTARESRALAFGTAGTVASVGVSVGDVVSAGQVLAHLDDTVVGTQVAAAEKALASAQARLDGDRAGLTDAQLASAKDPVTQAQSALDAALAGEKAAKAQRTAAVGAAQATLDEAEARLAADQAGGAADPIIALDELAIQAAQANLTSVRTQTDASVAQASAAVRSARLALTAAQHAYAVRTAPAPDALLSADEAAVASAEASLAAARQTLSLGIITSPIAGTVTEVGFRVGDRTAALGAGSALGSLTGASGTSTGRIVVEDLSALRVSSTASEIDVVSLALDQDATVTLDAIPDLSLTATICELGVTGSATQGVVEYPVTLCLDGGDPRLRAGMSTNVSIVLASRTDVLIVPTPAVRTVDGATIVRRLKADGTTEDVTVTVGISSGTRLEILSGLSEGDKVVVGGTSSGTGG